MSPPHRQCVAQVSAELGIHVVTLYNWRKAWRLQGKVVSASEKEPEGLNATDNFTVVLETAGLNATELSVYCLEHFTQCKWTAGGRHPSMPINSLCSP